MKKFRFLLALLCATAVFTLASCKPEEQDPIEPPVTEVEEFTVTFSTNGGSEVASKKVESGKKVAKPADPTKTGYTFVGWFKDANLTTAWNFDNDTVSANTTIYAKWTINEYKVTFNANGGSEVAEATVKHDNLVTKPENPTKNGHTFDGWYKEEALTTVFDFSKEKITAATTLYAKWTINTFTVTFDSQGGSNVAAATVNWDSLATAPENPTKAGFTFGGWYKEAACTNAFDFTTEKITAATIVYAKWTANQYTVAFDTQGGSAVASATVVHGNKVTAPAANPTKENQVFVGWFKEAAGTNAWNFETDTVTAATTIYAKWRDLTKWEAMATSANCYMATDFSIFTETDTLPQFSSWGTKGLFYSLSKDNPDPEKNNVKLSVAAIFVKA